MTLVLRKSYGPFSANTPIEMVTQPGKTRDIVEVRTARRVPVEFEHIQSYSQFDKPKSIIKRKDHATFSVPLEDIVQLKYVDEVGPNHEPGKKSDKKYPLVVQMNRKARRALDQLVYAKRMAYESK